MRARRGDGGLRLLPPPQPPYDDLALQRLRRRADVLSDGRDVFLMFKHEEDAGGALDAERLLAA